MNFKTHNKFLVSTILMLALTLFLSCKNQNDEANEIPPAGTTSASFDLTSVQMAQAVTIGWNLGNTLDAAGTNSYSYGLGLDTETFWGQPKTTKAMIQAIANSGFKTIRIPVSWHNHISTSDTTNYKIDSAWMSRVKTVVDWSIESGLIVILNIHHDNMSKTEISSNPGFCISTDSEIQSKSKTYISKVWSQVGTTFANYDAALIFEVLNEPRCVGESTEWWTNDKKLIDVVTDYEKTAIDAIRSSGGNNTQRFIMVPGYACSSDQNMLSNYTMPQDSVSGKLIMAVHAYTPYSFAMQAPGESDFTGAHKSELDKLFKFLGARYISNGIGVVIGETGAVDKNNLSDREEWFRYFFGHAYKSYGIPSVLWDNGAIANGGSDYEEKYGYFKRSTGTWYFPSLIKAAMDAVGITDYTIN